MSEIKYTFVASGHESVERAFLGIEHAAKRSSRGVEQAYTGQIRAARRSASEQERAARRPASRLEQLARQVERDQVNAAKREQRRQEAASRAEQRRRESDARTERRRHEVELARRQRNEERAAAASARTSSKLEERIARDRDRTMQRLARVRDRQAQTEQRLHERRLKQAQVEGAVAGRRSFSEQQRLQETVRRQNKPLLAGIGGQVAGMALGGAAAAGALGVGVAGAAVRGAYNLQGIANRLSINARKSGQDFIDPTTLRKEFEATSLASRGTVSAEQVGAGTSDFVTKTGRLDLARKFSSTFATAAAASGAEFADIASAGAELVKKFKIETVEEMQQALASITFGGKEGSFEIADASQKYAKLASAGAKFGLDKGVGGVKVLQGLSQVAMDSTGDRDVATTAVEAMLRQLVSESDQIEGLNGGKGPKVFTDASRTKTNPVEKLLPDVIAAAGGDLVKLQKIFGDEGSRGINPLITTFNDAHANAKGKDGKAPTEAERIAAGKAAVTKHLKGAIEAPGTWADMKLDADRATTGPAKLAAMWEGIVSKVGDKLLPVLDRIVDRFEVSEEALDAVVGTIEVLLQALEGFAKATGIIKDTGAGTDPISRKKAEEKRAEEAQKKLDALPSEEKAAALEAEGKHEEAAAMREQLKDPEMRNRIRKLNLERNKALNEVGKVESFEQHLSTIDTPEEFMADYIKSSGKDPNDPIVKMNAEKVAKAISSYGTGTRYATDDIHGETPEQKLIRERYAQNVSEGRILAGGKVGEASADLAQKGLSAAVMDLVKNTRTASEALKSIGDAKQASIYSG